MAHRFFGHCVDARENDQKKAINVNKNSYLILFGDKFIFEGKTEDLGNVYSSSSQSKPIEDYFKSKSKKEIMAKEMWEIGDKDTKILILTKSKRKMGR